jgi:hypothetical protein
MGMGVISGTMGILKVTQLKVLRTAEDIFYAGIPVTTYMYVFMVIRV